MKYYLCHFIQYDGEHEQYELAIVAAANEVAATAWAESQAFDTGDDMGDEDHPSIFAYQDGQTACKFKWLEEVPKSDALVLDKYNAANIYHAAN